MMKAKAMWRYIDNEIQENIWAQRHEEPTMYATESKDNMLFFIFSLFEDRFEKYLSGYILLKTKKYIQKLFIFYITIF